MSLTDSVSTITGMDAGVVERLLDGPLSAITYTGEVFHAVTDPGSIVHNGPNAEFVVLTASDSYSEALSDLTSALTDMLPSDLDPIDNPELEYPEEAIRSISQQAAERVEALGAYVRQPLTIDGERLVRTFTPEEASTALRGRGDLSDTTLAVTWERAD